MDEGLLTAAEMVQRQPHHQSPHQHWARSWKPDTWSTQYSQLDRAESISGISGSMSLFHEARPVSASCQWLARSACLRVSLYNLYSLCALGGRRPQCIPSVSETSWGFWVVAFLGLRSFPAGWTASPPFMASCVLIIIFPPRCMVLSGRKLVDNRAEGPDPQALWPELDP